MSIITYSLSQMGQPEDGIVGSSGKIIGDMKASGLACSEVEAWVTKQIGYDKDIINWVRKIYNQ